MDKNNSYNWTFEEEESQRIDKYLAEQQEEWSRSQVQEWLTQGLVTVNDRRVKANYKLSGSDQIHVQVPVPIHTQIEPEDIPLDIRFEDKDLLVVNKPRGLVVHPAPGHYTGTLVNALLAHCQDLSGINGLLRPGIVHRIDKDTSGLLVVAKHDQSHNHLAEQFKLHSIRREYMALVHGHIAHEQGTVNAPIGRHPQKRKEMAVVSTGKPAVTHFDVLERWPEYTLLGLKLETGRTHQIRVHMQYIEHPVVGDPKYSSASSFSIDGQALHARLLGFVHPSSNENMCFEVALPEDFQNILSFLRGEERQ